MLSNVALVLSLLPEHSCLGGWATCPTRPAWSFSRKLPSLRAFHDHPSVTPPCFILGTASPAFWVCYLPSPSTGRKSCTGQAVYLVQTSGAPQDPFKSSEARKTNFTVIRLHVHPPPRWHLSCRCKGKRGKTPGASARIPVVASTYSSVHGTFHHLTLAGKKFQFHLSITFVNSLPLSAQVLCTFCVTKQETQSTSATPWSARVASRKSTSLIELLAVFFVEQQV